jgi:hypothetical protein
MTWKGITIRDYELHGFFECGPEQDEFDGFTFHVARGPWVIAFGMNPQAHDVSLAVARDGEKVVEFVALGVRDVRWRGEGQRERIEVVLGDKHSVFLELRPNVAVVHHLGVEVRI